ncbi:MAG: hypothetical protein KAH77_02980, partial [Thiomargarita sp.]|nr:hypothetical protein [Thiomargarita sp.]
EWTDDIPMGTYYAAIRAYNNKGEYSLQSETAIIVLGLAKPDNLRVDYNDKGDLVIWWDVVTDAVGYSAYYGMYTNLSDITFNRVPDISSLPIEFLSLMGGQTFVKSTFPENTMLAAGKYYIAIQAYDAQGNGGQLSETVFKTVTLSPWQQPILTVDSEGADVTFSWKPLPGATQYHIVGGPPSELEALADYPTRKFEANVGNVNSWSISDLPEGIYDVKIRASDNEGNDSHYSEPVHFSIFYLKAACDIPERNAFYSVYQLLYEPFLGYAVSDIEQKINEFPGDSPHNRVEQALKVTETILLVKSVTGSGSFTKKSMEIMGSALSMSGSNIFIPELIDGVNAMIAGTRNDLLGLADYFINESVGIINPIWVDVTADSLRKQLEIIASSQMVLDKYYWHCSNHDNILVDVQIVLNGDNCQSDLDFLTCAAIQYHQQVYGTDDNDINQKISETISTILQGVNTSIQSLSDLVIIHPNNKPILRVAVNYPEIELVWPGIQEATGYKIFAALYTTAADIDVNNLDAVSVLSDDKTSILYTVDELTNNIPQGTYYIILQADYTDGTQGLSDPVIVDFREPEQLSDQQLLELYAPMMHFAEDDYTPRAIDGFVNHAILVEEQSKIVGFNPQVIDNDKYQSAINDSFEVNPEVKSDDFQKSSLSGTNPPTALNSDVSYSLDFLNAQGGQDYAAYSYALRKKIASNPLSTKMFIIDNFEYINPFKSFFPMNAQSDPVVYGHVITQGDKTYLQYHFFYYINQWNGNGGPIDIGYHEGDWEYMVIELDTDHRPLRISSSIHVPNIKIPVLSSNCTSQLGGETRNWNDIDKTGTHPQVYIGAGGHPTYLYKGITAYLAVEGQPIPGWDKHYYTDKVYISNDTIPLNDANATSITYQIVRIDEDDSLCDDVNVCAWLKQNIIWGHINNLIPDTNEIIESPVTSPIARFLNGEDDNRWNEPQTWMDEREPEQCDN